MIARGATRSTGRVLFDGSLRGGMQSLGLAPAHIGIAVGAPADFVALDPASPSLAERRDDALLDSLIFAGGTRCVADVWRAGRKIVSGGQHHARSRIESGFRAALRRLLAA